MNSEQRRHLARSLQTAALGRLAFFGYRAIQAQQLSLVALTLAAYAILDGIALYLLRGDI